MPIALWMVTIGAENGKHHSAKVQPTIATSLRFIDAPTSNYRSQTLVSPVMNGVVDGYIVFASNR